MAVGGTSPGVTRPVRDGWPLAIGRMQSSVRALADDTVATPSRKRIPLHTICVSPSDLDRHVEVVPELGVAAAHKEIPVAQVGPVDDHRSTWLQVGAAEPLVLR